MVVMSDSASYSRCLFLLNAFKSFMFEPAHENFVFILYASSEGSSETAQTRSLTTAFAARAHNAWTTLETRTII